MQSKHYRHLAALMLAVMVGACASTPPTRFYALSAEDAQVSGTTDSRVIIGVGPIEVAPYLERGQIVTRGPGNRLELADFDQWAEPIETSIARVVAANLDALVPGIQAIVRPWPDTEPAYTVMIKFSRFDTDASGEAGLDADWGIVDEGQKRMAVVRDARIRRPGGGADYNAVAGSLSEALAELSREIASELKGLLRPQ